MRVRGRVRAHTCMVKGGAIGALGGGWLEQPRQWRGAQWAGLSLGVPTAPQRCGSSGGRRWSRAGELAAQGRRALCGTMLAHG
eukprot:scaffold70743_cov60-Phaeocystis_antarctica.AAC.2